jgi:hypothetical protein
MNKNAVFTICAKNYLAQAFTLKKSFEKHNPDCDFYIFLSDDSDGLGDEVNDILLLDDSWIPNWMQMAFKYNVIEFSTSIKPFCFNKIFKQNYSKVIYLDPDTYVTNSLDEIFGFLDQKSIVLTPHYCNIQTEYTGSITEEEILFVGIYNLGFCAIKKDVVGGKIVDWWMNRLANKCYADKFDALHVDQKWMDFVPSFFPNDTLITHHLGINPAIWNLHERELILDKDNQFKIRDTINHKIFPLLFFHFSGFDPFNPKLINRRHPKYNTEIYPSYIPLFDEYIKGVYENGYSKFSKMNYSFNAFEDGENILPLYRRLYRTIESEIKESNPFATNGQFFLELKKNNLLTGIKSAGFSISTDKERSNKANFVKIIVGLFGVLRKLFGIKYYNSLVVFLNDFTRFEKQDFLLKKKK